MGKLLIWWEESLACKTELLSVSTWLGTLLESYLTWNFCRCPGCTGCACKRCAFTFDPVGSEKCEWLPMAVPDTLLLGGMFRIL